MEHRPLSRKRQIAADAVLLLVAFFWGATFIVVKQAIETVDVFVFLAQRFALAFVLLVPLALIGRPRVTRAALLRGALLGVLLFGSYAFQTVGLQYTSASNAAFVTGLNVVLVPVVAALLFREQVSVNTAAGVGAASLGLYLLCLPAEGWALNRGDLLVLACAGCVAFHIVFTGRFARKSDVFQLTAVQIGVVAALSALFAWGGGESVAVWRPGILFALLICTVFATVFAFLAQTAMQRFTTPARAALIFCMEPVFGALCAWWAAGETLGPWGLLGAALILLGMTASELPPASGLLRRLRREPAALRPDA